MTSDQDMPGRIDHPLALSIEEMFVKLQLIQALIVMSMATPACAQMITMDGSRDLPETYSVRLPIRVTESFAVPLSSDATNLDQSIGAARRQIYKMMQDECGTLAETFKVECRIVSFNVTLGRNFGPATVNNTSVPPIRSVDASVSYGLKVND